MCSVCQNNEINSKTPSALPKGPQPEEPALRNLVLELGGAAGPPTSTPRPQKCSAFQGVKLTGAFGKMAGFIRNQKRNICSLSLYLGGSHSCEGDWGDIYNHKQGGEVSSAKASRQGMEKSCLGGDGMSRSPAPTPSRWEAGLRELFENRNMLLAHGLTCALSPRGQRDRRAFD